MKKSISTQLFYMIRKKTVVVVFLMIMLMVVINCIWYMTNIYGTDITQITDPYKNSALSRWSPIRYYFMQFYPIILIIPTADLYYNDKKTKNINYMISRIGTTSYYVGKVIAVWIITFFIFTIPFILEICAYGIIFPKGFYGDPSKFELYQSILDDKYLFLSKIYFKSRFLYSIICILIFGIVSGILSVFNFALSTVKIMKYRVFTYFPIYLLLFFIGIISKFMNLSFETNYSVILTLKNTQIM